MDLYGFESRVAVPGEALGCYKLTAEEITRMSVPQIQASMETLAREDKEVGELVEVDDPKNITAEQQKKFQGDDGVQDYLALNQALKSMQGGESFREESLKEAALAYQAKLRSEEHTS